jgi:magnesium and cobalt transporter
MSDELHHTTTPSRSWLEKLGQVLAGEPRDRQELIEILREATERRLLDANSLGMIEGVLQIAELRVRDIMIPRSQMIVIEQDMPLDQILPIVMTTVHSRFPVIGENKDEIVGFLLAKDLLAFAFGHHEKPFDIREVLRSAMFVPESKRLDVLLQEFRRNRNHMAVVVDEYGGVTGLVTIEDVLEQIVGDIEDEYDTEDDQQIKQYNDNLYAVKALTTLDQFNEFFSSTLEAKEVETIGGLVIREFGRLPKRGESVEIDHFRFKVLRADKRRIHLLQVIPGYSSDKEKETE